MSKFVIPVSLDESSVPSGKIRDLHIIKLYPKWEQGLEQLIKSIPIRTTTKIKSTRDKGLSYIRMGRYKEAIECFDKILKIKPNDLESLSHKGYTYSSLGEYWTAIECLKKVIEIEPSNTTAWHNLSHCYSRVSLEEQAKECHEKVKGLKKGNSVFKNYLSRYLNKVR